MHLNSGSLSQIIIFFLSYTCIYIYPPDLFHGNGDDVSMVMLGCNVEYVVEVVISDLCTLRIVQDHLVHSTACIYWSEEKQAKLSLPQNMYM